MSGLEEIIKQIHKDSETEISEILSKAEAQCKEILDAGKRETKHLVEEKARQTKKEAELLLHRMKSEADTKKKQEILRVKQRMILDILEKTQEYMENQETKKYYEMLLKIVKNNAHKEKGIICLNEKDLSRIPEDFVDSLNKMGIPLEVSEKPVDIKNGMILCYGNIEENCTFKSFIEANRENLVDKVSGCIFGE